MAVATFAMAGASALQAVAYLSKFGASSRTDAFFAAFALYTVFGVFTQSIRVTSVSLLVGDDRRMRGRDLAATLGVIGVVTLAVCEVLAAPLADLLAPGLSAADRVVTVDALRILGGAMVLQLAAAGAATLLGVWGRFDVVAGGYTFGAVVGLATYFAVVGATGELSLAWAALAMGVAAAAWMAVGVARQRSEEPKPPGLPAPAKVTRDAALILGRTAIYFVFNALFLITLAFATQQSGGEATLFSYAYLFVSYLVAGTGTALGITRAPELTRGARNEWADVVSVSVPHGYGYAALVCAPAVGALSAGGAQLLAELFPSTLSVADADTLALFAILLSPWLAAALLFNLTLPAGFAVDQARLINLLAIPLVVVHVAVTFAAEAVAGIDGIVGAMFVAPFLYVTVVLAVICGPKLGSVGHQIAADSLRFGGLAAACFGLAALAGALLPDGIGSELAVIGAGSAAYAAAVVVVARRKIDVLIAAVRGGGLEASRG